MKKPLVYRSTREAPAIMSLEQAAALLGFTYECVKSRAQHGTLAGAFRSGKSWRVDKEALIASFGTRQEPDCFDECTNLECAIRDLEGAIRDLISVITTQPHH